MRVNVMETKPKTEGATSAESDDVIPPSVSFSETLLVTKPGESINIFASADFGTGDGDTAYTWTVEGPSAASIADSKKRFSTFEANAEGIPYR